MENRIIETKLVNWKSIKDLQPEKIKNKSNIRALEYSLKKYGFSMPFYGYEEKEIIYCVDGHTRKEVLNNMDGVPELLPCTLIKAENKKEAIKLLLEVFNQKQNLFNNDLLDDWINYEELNDIEFNYMNIDYIKQVEEKEEIEAEIKFSQELDRESNYVVLKFNKDIDFLHIESLLGLESTYSLRQNGKVWAKGRGRVIDGIKAIEKIKAYEN